MDDNEGCSSNNTIHEEHEQKKNNNYIDHLKPMNVSDEIEEMDFVQKLFDVQSPCEMDSILVQETCESNEKNDVAELHLDDEEEEKGDCGSSDDEEDNTKEDNELSSENEDDISLQGENDGTSTEYRARRPQRQKAIEALEKIKEIHEWETCKESSEKFQNVAKIFNEQFDAEGVSCAWCDEDDEDEMSSEENDSGENYSGVSSSSDNDESEGYDSSFIDDEDDEEDFTTEGEWLPNKKRK